MRTNEPFHGIVLVGGHVVFHVALLMASLLIIQEPKRTDLNKNFLDYIEMYRVAHLVNIVYKMFDFCLSSPTKFNKYMFSQKMFETISMFLYFLVAMYSIWGISKHDVDTQDIADHKML
jgi:hypothetical protein